MSTTHSIPGSSGWASQAAGWGTSAAGRGHLRLKCVRSYDESTNRSTLSFTAWVYSEYYAEASFQATEGSTIKVGGSPVVTFHDGGSSTLHKVNVYRDTTWRQLKSVNGPNEWTVTLPHDASGRLSTPVKLDLTLICTIGSVTYVMKWSDSVTFTVTEPRGSAVESVTSPVNTGESLTLRMLRSSTAHRHKATVRCGSATLCSSGAFGESLSIPVPRSWFQNYPAAASLVCTVSVQTYTDSSCTAALGDPRTVSVTVNADADMRPALAEGYAAAAADNSGTAAAGISGFVSGLSRALVTLDSAGLDMSAAVGATVASIAVTGGGVTDTEAPYLTGVLTGTAAVTVTVTDSRGRSASRSLTVETMPWAPPTIGRVSVFRCDSAGAGTENGNYVSASAAVSCSSLNGQNSLTLTASWAEGSGSYGAETALTVGAANVLGGSLDPDKKLSVRLRAVDSLGAETEVYVLLPPRVWAMKFRPDGRGVGFGMAPTEDCVLQLPAGWKIKIGSTVVAGS